MYAKVARPRFALWVVACVLLLKSALPMLASAAAGLQGKAVGDICKVYGVRTSAPKSPHEAHVEHGQRAAHEHRSADAPPHSSDSHTADHCALTALAALAGQVFQPLRPIEAPADEARGHARSRPAIRDAAAAWAARHKHGPPRAV